jgi:hypothetical protein
MIRLFTAICKTIRNKDNNDSQLFLKSTAAYRHHSGKCPRCGAVGKLTSYGNYSRGLTTLINGKQADFRIKPLRFECTSCKATHALLPDVLIPHSPYSLRFVLGVLAAYAARETIVEKICLSFGIAVSTLYRWKKRFLSQKMLFLGYLFDKDESYIVFLNDLLGYDGCLSARLQDFFMTHGFSFMQNIRLATHSVPP